MNILQVGLGNFGKRHLEAWHRLGLGDQLWICETNESQWRETARYRFPQERMVRALPMVMDRVDIVDIVTPTQTHFDLCREALQCGKDVFVEKPMTMTSEEAQAIAGLAERQQRLVQVGFYYRFHPASQRLKAEIQKGTLGRLRYLSGNFMGFKRARTDVGVTHTDGIHFLDLFNWLTDSVPVQVYAVCRDHFGRGLEDFSVVLLSYPGGACAKVESGYIQPGRWKDKVVSGAMTSKEIMVVGEKATAEIDFEMESLTIHDVQHEPRNGTWDAVVGNSVQPGLEPCDPVQMVCRELEAFLSGVRNRSAVSPGPMEGGVHLAVLMESIYESARTGAPVQTGLLADGIRL